MAVTRIKSNQIATGAVEVTNLKDYAISGTKLANALTYGSDLTVSGNLTVNGTTTTVDTVNTTIDDPILLLGSNQTGAGAVDLGILGERGDDTNVFVGYDESADEFVTALVSDAESSTTVTITDYADMHVGGLTADDAITATGNVTGGNLITSAAVESATVTATGAVTGGSLTDGTATLSSGALSGATSGAFSTTLTATGNITGGNLITSAAVESATVTATGAVEGGSLTDGTATLSSGALSGATSGAFSTTLTATGNVTGGNLVTSADVTTATVTASGAITSASLTSTGTVEGATVTDGTASLASGSLTSAVNVTASGTVTGGTLTDGTASISSGAMTGATNITASGTVTGGTLTDGTASLASGSLTSAVNGTFSGTVTGGTLTDGTASIASGAITGVTTATASGNVTAGNFVTAGTVDTATLETSGAATLGGTLDVTGNTTVANFEVDASSTLNFNENTLGNVGTPVSSGDATTKGYVDGLLSSGFTITDGVTTETVSQGDTLTFAGTANEVTVAVSATDTLTIGLPDDVEVTGDLTVGGNLVVQGSQTIVDATSTSIVDPIIQLGRGANNAALTANDGKDRGVAMYYYSGSEKVAYLGWDDPSNEFRFIPEATITDEAVTGSLGTANLGKVRVDSIDIDANSITTTAGDLDLSAAGTGKVTLPTGNELVIDDLADTGVLFSNSGELTSNATAFYWDGTELYADNMYSGGYLNVDGTANIATLEVSGGAAIDGAITSVTNITASGTVTGGTVTDGTASITSGAVTGVTTLTASGAITGGSLTDGTATISSGAITGATSGTFSTTLTATGNVTGGNLITSAAVESATVTATGTVEGATVTDGTASLASGALSGVTTATASGNVTAGNFVTSGTVDTATLETSGEATLASATVSDLTSGRVVLAGTSGAIEDSTNLTFDGSTLAVTGALTASTTATVTGNITGGNLITSAAVESATVTATGTVEGGTLTDGTMSVNAGAVTGVASLVVDNITVDGDDITTSGSALTINDAGADVDFRVESSTNANMLVVDAGSDAVMIGTATATTDVSFKVGTTDSMMLPVGTTAQRPATGAGGMLRYNSSTDQYEGYDVSEAKFKALGVPEFTVIASETFSGDDTTTAFTLGSEQTTASCIVSINGVVQLPTTSYSVSGTTLTFTEAPATGDAIEVREITTTTTVASLANGDATVTIETLDSGIEATGNIVPTVDATYNLGSATNGWATIYGEATSAQYADLAEKYEADADYEPGTVVHFGGDKEVAMCDKDHCTRVAGVVSTAPAYRMNDGLEAEHTAMVALQGRVPCKVTGPVAKGDMMVSAGNGMARAEANPTYGAVIGKALEAWEGGEGVIEVVVK